MNKLSINNWSDIAKMYGVSQQTICDIKHSRIYKHVEV